MNFKSAMTGGGPAVLGVGRFRPQSTPLSALSHRVSNSIFQVSTLPSQHCFSKRIKNERSGVRTHASYDSRA